jgi:hypothetical protein
MRPAPYIGVDGSNGAVTSAYRSARVQVGAWRLANGAVSRYRWSCTMRVNSGSGSGAAREETVVVISLEEHLGRGAARYRT